MIIFSLHIIVLLILAFLLWTKAPVSLKKFFWPALLLKCFCGLALGLLYIHYYDGGDTLAYFEDASVIASLVHQDPSSYLRFLFQGDHTFVIWSELNYSDLRALFLSKIASIFALLTQSYWITSLYFSFISFLGAWFLVRHLSKQYPELRLAAIFTLLFFPSILFWTSGLVKESISMAVLYFLVVIFLKVYQREKVWWWEWLLTPVACWILWNLKYYYLAVFLPVVSTALVLKLWIYPVLKVKNSMLAVVLWLAVLMVPLLIVSRIHPNFYPEYFLEVVVSNYHAFADKSNPGDMIVFEQMTPTPDAIILNAPKALFSGLFRPLVWETMNNLQVIAAMENMAILILTIVALANVKKLLRSPEKLLLMSVLVYVVVLCVFLALSTPNYGTLVRYRVGFLPFFILLIMMENRLFSKATTFFKSIFSGLVWKKR